MLSSPRRPSSTIRVLSSAEKFRRVEVAYPIQDPVLRKRVYKDLQHYLKDNLQAWNLNTDGSYERIGVKGRAHPFSAQQTLLETLAERA